MTFRKLSRTLLTAALTAALALSMTAGAFACTTLYVGGDLTEDGNPIVARSEDYTNSRGKMFYISPAGEYRQGELYVGCAEYGAFEWTWTHDSYRFIAFKADNEFDPEGRCPECGLPGHPSYTESGTNEKGVTVSATESLRGNGKVNAEDVDPLRQTKVDGVVGIEESDIPTVILSEAATAREGLELLLDIYDNYGCYYASGLFIADQEEIWYIENCSGTQYVALKLPADLMFLEPNISVIGEIDLDDTENVIASGRHIEVAKLAGTFVGDEAENIIDFRASYANLAVSSKNRLSNGLNFVNSAYDYTEEELLADSTLFTISNVKDGEIVPLYSNIEADRLFTPDDVANYYKVDGIANTGNTDTAFFQIDPDKCPELGTVEWTSMSHGAYNVFIPNYPLLMNETYEAYRSPVGEAQKQVEEKPEGGLYYRTAADGTYTVLPEGWETSFYWCFDGLSNYILYSQYDDGPVTNEAVAYVVDQFAALQEEIYDGFDALNVELAKLDLTKAADLTAAREAVTAYNADMSEKAHQLALEMIGYVRDHVMPFRDVSTESWYFDAVSFAYDQGLLSGTADDAFTPNGTLTRAMMAQILYRLAGTPAVTSEMEAYTDVPDDAWYLDAVYWATEQGIITGTGDGKFSPSAPITREQLAVMLYRYAGSPAVSDEALSFADKDSVSGYAESAVIWAADQGILSGKEGNLLDPQGSATRAQAAQMLMNFCALDQE